MSRKESPLVKPTRDIWVVAMENEGIVFEVFTSERAALRAAAHHQKKHRLRASVTKYRAEPNTFRAFTTDVWDEEQE